MSERKHGDIVLTVAGHAVFISGEWYWVNGPGGIVGLRMDGFSGFAREDYVGNIFQVLKEWEDGGA